jgi:hypothetical protein
VARKTIEFDRVFEPRPENADMYDQLFARYTQLQETLKPLFYRSGDAP